jgi:RND family efflux transporter MFP subunit
MNKNVLICLIAGCLLIGEESTSAQVSVVGATRTVRAYGLTVPKDQVFLQAAIDGHVRQVFFSEGQFVKAGDLIIELACEPAKARRKIAQLEAENTGLLAGALAEQQVAQTSLDRLNLLHQQNAASQQEFNEAELRLKRANAAVQIERERMAANQARFELADAELEQFMLRAPFDGQVVQVQAGPGSPVSQSTDLVQIVSLDTYRVDLFLPVEQANELEVGQMIPIQINAPFERSATAKVVFRSPLIEAATGTTRVVLEIDNRALKLPAGVTVSLSDNHSL